jgi:hypothetical protein
MKTKDGSLEPSFCVGVTHVLRIFLFPASQYVIKPLRLSIESFEKLDYVFLQGYSRFLGFDL